MPVAVPIVAGTAIRGVAATVMMRSVLERHPNAFLITLAHFGVAMSLDRSQEHIHADIEAGLAAQGREPGSPVVLVGHSQGGLASLRYAIDNQDQVKHVISVGAPWRGSVSAQRISRLFSWTGRNLTPALSDMAEGSPLIVACDMPEADRSWLQMAAVWAEREAKLISQRTKAALAAARARGVTLGGYRGVAITSANGALGRAAQATRAREMAQAFAPVLVELREAGIVSTPAIAAELNQRSIPTPRGGRWHAASVARMVHRLA